MTAAQEGVTVAAGPLEVRFHELDKAVAAGFAEMRGSISTLAASKDGIHSRLEDKIDQTRAMVALAETQASAAHQRIDLYPKPDAVETAIRAGQATATRLDRMIWFIAGSGMLGGGLGAAVVSMFTS